MIYFHCKECTYFSAYEKRFEWNYWAAYHTESVLAIISTLTEFSYLFNNNGNSGTQNIR